MIFHHFVSSEPGVGYWTTKRINKHVPRGKALDVACGARKIPFSVTLDYDASVDPDYLIDVSRGGWPFADESFDEVFCLNFLEHLPPPNVNPESNFDNVMTDAWRVLKKDGILHVEVPYYNSYNHAQTPFHVSIWSEKSFRDWYTPNGQFARYTKAKFEILEEHYFFTQPARLIPTSVRLSLSHFIPNLCYQMYFKMKKAPFD